MTEQTPRLLIIGCGYLGLRVGERAKSAGWSVSATSRSRLAFLEEQGFAPVRFDWNEARDLALIANTIETEGIDRILIAISHDRRSNVDRYVSQVDGLARFLGAVRSASNARPTPDVVYISTTGVYHQTGGVWVDESSTTRPTRDGGRAHLIAESKLRSCLGTADWTILRLSGIYGPGRVPRAADVRAGRPIASPPDGHLNLIHVDDAASGVMSAFSWRDRNATSLPPRQRLYVVSDDSPVLRRQFYQEIATQTNSPAPTFVDPAADSGVRFRSETDKRVWNRQFKRDLVPKLQYPGHIEGLRSIL